MHLHAHMARAWTRDCGLHGNAAGKVGSCAGVARSEEESNAGPVAGSGIQEAQEALEAAGNRVRLLGIVIPNAGFWREESVFFKGLEKSRSLTAFDFITTTAPKSAEET